MTTAPLLRHQLPDARVNEVVEAPDLMYELRLGRSGRRMRVTRPDIRTVLLSPRIPRDSMSIRRGRRSPPTVQLPCIPPLRRRLDLMAVAEVVILTKM